jgi:hypothetical protein
MRARWWPRWSLPRNVRLIHPCQIVGYEPRALGVYRSYILGPQSPVVHPQGSQKCSSPPLRTSGHDMRIPQSVEPFLPRRKGRSADTPSAEHQYRHDRTHHRFIHRKATCDDRHESTRRSLHRYQPRRRRSHQPRRNRRQLCRRGGDAPRALPRQGYHPRLPTKRSRRPSDLTTPQVGPPILSPDGGPIGYLRSALQCRGTDRTPLPADGAYLMVDGGFSVNWRGTVGRAADMGGQDHVAERRIC